MGARSGFTDEEKLSALQRLNETGISQAALAKEMGVSDATIILWINKKEQIRERAEFARHKAQKDEAFSNTGHIEADINKLLDLLTYSYDELMQYKTAMADHWKEYLRLKQGDFSVEFLVSKHAGVASTMNSYTQATDRIIARIRSIMGDIAHLREKLTPIEKATQAQMLSSEEIKKKMDLNILLEKVLVEVAQHGVKSANA